VLLIIQFGSSEREEEGNWGLCGKACIFLQNCSKNQGLRYSNSSGYPFLGNCASCSPSYHEEAGEGLASGGRPARTVDLPGKPDLPTHADG
jgi:hypothetical protein